MPQELTKQDILELFKESDRRFTKRLEEFDKRLEKEASAREKSREELEKELTKSRKEFDKRLGDITNMWGLFVEELVQPNSIQLFVQRGIDVVDSVQHIKGKRNGKDDYEIDLLLYNKKYVVVVEVKSQLKQDDVDEHLERLKKIQENPPAIVNLKGKTLLGAVAGIVIDKDVDRYAYKKGLFVLRQQGNIVEIANDENFVPREWKVA
jgi:hypothetical protein